MSRLDELHQFYNGPVPPAERAAAIKAAIEGAVPDPPHVIWRKCWRDAVERQRDRDARAPYVGRELRSYFHASAEETAWRRHCVARYAATKPRASLAQAAE